MTEVTSVETSNYRTIQQTILLALMFSLLNPHVYLDTIVLIGGYSLQFPEFTERIEFASGAASFSVLWFFSLAFFSLSLRKFLNSPQFMKKMTLFSGFILMFMACRLSFEVYKWFQQL